MRPRWARADVDAHGNVQLFGQGQVRLEAGIAGLNSPVLDPNLAQHAVLTVAEHLAHLFD